MKRYCFHVTETNRLKSGQFAVLKVTRDQPGYEVTDIPCGTTIEEAEESVRDTNARIGVTPQEAAEIIGSSMKAQNQRSRRSK